MLSTLRIELRRAPARWWVPVMVAVGVVWLFARSGDWSKVWPQAAAAAQATTVFLAPMAAAAAAIGTGRRHQPGFSELTAHAPQPFWYQHLTQLMASLIYAVSAFLAVTGMALSAPLSAGVPAGELWGSYVILGTITMVAGTALGHWAGLLLAGPAAPAVSAVAIFIVLGVIPSDSPYNFTVISGSPEFRLNPSALAIRAVIAGALVLIAVSWPRTRVRWGYLAVAPSVGITAAVLAATAMGPVGFPQITRPPGQSPLCSTTSPQVCLWPENRAYLAQTAQTAQKVAAAADGVLTLPTRFYESGLRHTPEGQPPGFSLRAGTYGIVGDMVNEMLPRPPACDRAFTDQQISQYATSHENLSTWLFIRATGEPATLDDTSEEIVRVLKQPEPEQTAWARAQVTALKGMKCPV